MVQDFGLAIVAIIVSCKSARKEQKLRMMLRTCECGIVILAGTGLAVAASVIPVRQAPSLHHVQYSCQFLLSILARYALQRSKMLPSSGNETNEGRRARHVEGWLTDRRYSRRLGRLGFGGLAERDCDGFYFYGLGSEDGMQLNTRAATLCEREGRYDTDGTLVPSGPGSHSLPESS